MEKSQQEKVLGHLQAGQSITPIEALNNYGCFRLAAVIHKLKQKGYTIESTSVSRNGKCFAKYQLVLKPQLDLSFKE